jgi:hypothetical protein
MCHLNIRYISLVKFEVETAEDGGEGDIQLRLSQAMSTSQSNYSHPQSIQ